MGSIDLGAPISFLSQFPGEDEIPIPPMLFLEERRALLVSHYDLKRAEPFLCERKVDCVGVVRLFNLSRLFAQSVPCRGLMPGIIRVFLLIPIMFLLFKLWNSASRLLFRAEILATMLSCPLVEPAFLTYLTSLLPQVTIPECYDWRARSIGIES